MSIRELFDPSKDIHRDQRHMAAFHDGAFGNCLILLRIFIGILRRSLLMAQRKRSVYGQKSLSMLLQTALRSSFGSFLIACSLPWRQAERTR